MRRISANLAAAWVLVMVAAPAGAGSTDYLLELGGVDGESQDDKHKGQIEILSFSWGATQTSAGFGHGGGGGTGKVAIHDIPPPRPDGGQTDALTDGLLIVRNSEPAGTASQDMTLKGSKIGENAPAAGGVRVAVGDVDGEGRAESKRPSSSQRMLVPGATKPTSQATGKRVHKPLRARSYVDAPLAKGSLTVTGKFPGCVVGARYPVIRLGNAARRYTLSDAIITSCGTAPGQELPMEEASFNYAKIN